MASSVIVKHHHQDCEASTSALIFKGLSPQKRRGKMLSKRLNLFVEKGKGLLIKAQSTGRKSRLTTIYI